MAFTFGSQGWTMPRLDHENLWALIYLVRSYVPEDEGPMTFLHTLLGLLLPLPRMTLACLSPGEFPVHQDAKLPNPLP